MERERERAGNVSRGATVNLTNLIHLAQAGDGVIKSTQVTNGGESNYFTNKRKRSDRGEGEKGTPCSCSPPILLSFPISPSQTMGPSLLCSLFFLVLFIAIKEGSLSLQ